jgi:hypothetical protein
VSNPEDAVLDLIDQLVNEQLEQESSGYDHNINQDRCALCGGDWHGTAAPDEAGPATGLDRQRIPDCPGALATDEQRGQWKTRRQHLHRDRAVTGRTVVTVPSLIYALRGVPALPGADGPNGRTMARTDGTGLRRGGRHRAHRSRRPPAHRA